MPGQFGPESGGQHLHNIHFPPLTNLHTRVLILGTIPGGDSLKASMYYANENNHFWDFIYRVVDKGFPNEKLVEKVGNKDNLYKYLTDHQIGLWDVLDSCTRKGSNDSKIKDEIVNDIASFITPNIKVIFCNGNKAFKYLKDSGQLEEITIPVKVIGSTSTLSPTNTFKTLNQWRDEINHWLV